MQKINHIKFGISCGLTAMFVYLSCIILMMFIGEDGVIRVSNLLFHGMEFSNIIRMDIPLTDNILGLIMSFFLWGGLGSILAMIYNKLSS